MTMDAATIARLEKIDNAENVSPRLETFAMASYTTHSKGIAAVGISPAKEALKSNLPVHIVQGNYLNETDNGILIGEGLSRYLNVKLGDTLALLGQGYHGASAAGLFPISGILRMPIAEMDNSLVYMNIQAAQQFIDMPDGYSGILIALNDDRELAKTMETVKEIAGDQELEILSWRETMQDLLRTSESDKAFAKLILLILYLIVGFGILGTVIMMTNERRHEFTVMISLGMQRWQLKWVFTVELILMALCGVIASLVATIPIVRWFHVHPIELTGDLAKSYADYGMEPSLPMSTDPAIFVSQIIIVFVLACLTLFYPYRIIGRLLKVQLH
jgi:ABC-type lipoprotein release transport system permease subunit